MSIGRQEAFELFRRDYSHNQMIDDNKMVLKQRYAEAKSLGETVNQARVKISESFSFFHFNLVVGFIYEILIFKKKWNAISSI